MNENEATLVWADEYSRMAEAYDRNVAPFFEPMARKVADLAAPKPGELFLDVGTGTGLLACIVAPRVAPQSVVAIDLADGALSVASYRGGNLGLRNLRFEMMDSRNIVYRGNLFDAVVSSFGIPALGFAKVFAEMFRVLKPGGRFAFVEWAEAENPVVAVVNELIETYQTATPSARLAEVRAARDFTRGRPEFASFFEPRTIESALQAAGFEDIRLVADVDAAVFDPPERHLDFRLSYGREDLEVSEMDPRSREAFRRDAIERLRSLSKGGVLTVTWRTRYGFARKS